jgi:hypothetical protein
MDQRQPPLEPFTPPKPPSPVFSFDGHDSEFATPEQQGLPIWRYMDLAKFAAMLSTRALYFTRADHFEDRFEGAITLARYHARIASHEEQRRRGKPIKLTATEQVFVEDAILNTAINCWHASEYESAAMWKLYAPAGWLGVAVRSTYQQLVASLPRGDGGPAYDGPWMRVLPIRVAKVRYINYDDEKEKGSDPFLLKRKSFEHEREIRAIVEDLHSFQGDPRAHLAPELRSRFPAGGVLVPVDLHQLIDHVYVPPLAPAWFRNTVEDVVGKYGIPARVNRSELDGDPLH